MVLAATIDAMLEYLKPQSNYSIWSSTLLLLRKYIEASAYERVLFVACDNQACVLQGVGSPQVWSTQNPQLFLTQILALPDGWPSSSVGFYQCETLGADLRTNSITSVFVRSSPTSFIFPTSEEGQEQGGEAIARCDPAHRLGQTGSVFVLRRTFLSVAVLPEQSLQSSMCALAPELTYFRIWLWSAGLADLPSQFGNYTILAPTNAAFEALARAAGLTPEALVRTPSFSYMAGYHILCGFFGPLARKQPSTPVASDGFPLIFKSVPVPSTEGTTFAQYVNFAKIDLSLSGKTLNGLLYVIDSVLSHGSSGPAPCG
jgi:uncharacterized surface protein with fasciclin (FAS1) repeats